MKICTLLPTLDQSRANIGAICGDFGDYFEFHVAHTTKIPQLCSKPLPSSDSKNTVPKNKNSFFRSSENWHLPVLHEYNDQLNGKGKPSPTKRIL